MSQGGRARGFARARELLGGRCGGGYGVMETGGLRLERWLDGSVLGELGLEERLAVVGGRLLLRLPGPVLRRRLALALSERSPRERAMVLADQGAASSLEELLVRRVQEVFIRVAREGVTPGQELELLGLYAVLMATVLQEPTGWERVQEALGEPGRSRARGFGLGALGSRHPEIGQKLGIWLEREFGDG